MLLYKRNTQKKLWLLKKDLQNLLSKKIELEDV